MANLASLRALPASTGTAAAFVLGYALAVAVGYASSLGFEPVACIWPASGVLLAALLVLEVAQWWPILAAAFAIEVAGASLTYGLDVPWMVALQASTTVTAVVGALLVRRYLKGGVRGGGVELRSLREFFALAVLGAGVGPAVGALLGALSVRHLVPGATYAAAWQLWWAANALGVLVGTPLVLSWRHWLAKGRPRATLAGYLEAGLFLATLFLTTQGVFGSDPKPIQRITDFPCAIVPLLIWGALRLHLACLALGTLGVALLAIWNTSAGHGPFLTVGASTAEHVFALQSFLVGILGITLTLGLAIVDRRRAQAKQREVEEHYRDAQKLEVVGLLTSAVAHDFANFLTAIRGYASILQSELRERPDLEHWAVQIGRAGDSAAALVDRLLAFGRRAEPLTTETDIGQSLLELRPILEVAKGSHVDLELQAAADTPLCVLIDPRQLEQIVLNLVINARDAMPLGGQVTVSADAAIGPAGHPTLAGLACARLSVRDTGTGMDAATRGRIFEPFFTTKGEGRGTGLGLSTVASIVAESGGAIDVQSELHKGSTFSILWPRRQAKEPAAVLPKRELSGGPSRVPGGR